MCPHCMHHMDVYSQITESEDLISTSYPCNWVRLLTGAKYQFKQYFQSVPKTFRQTSSNGILKEFVFYSKFNAIFTTLGLRASVFFGQTGLV